MKKDKEQVLFHLGYEWWMFRAAHDLLQKLPSIDDPVRNALVESLAIHGRGLTYFFHEKKRFQTDWNVDDLDCGLTTTPCPHKLDEWRVDANERVAHLTAGRKRVLTEWDAPAARRLLGERIEEVRTALGRDMPSDWMGDCPTTSELLSAVGFAPAPGPGVGVTGSAGP